MFVIAPEVPRLLRSTESAPPSTQKPVSPHPPTSPGYQLAAGGAWDFSRLQLSAPDSLNPQPGEEMWGAKQSDPGDERVHDSEPQSPPFFYLTFFSCPPQCRRTPLSTSQFEVGASACGKGRSGVVAAAHRSYPPWGNASSSLTHLWLQGSASLTIASPPRPEVALRLAYTLSPHPYPDSMQGGVRPCACCWLTRARAGRRRWLP